MGKKPNPDEPTRASLCLIGTFLAETDLTVTKETADPLNTLWGGDGIPTRWAGCLRDCRRGSAAGHGTGGEVNLTNSLNTLVRASS